MTEPLLIAFSVTGLIIVGIFILLAVVFIRVNSLIKTNSESSSQELIRLQQLHEVSLKEGFSESRKELRDVSSENRRETQDAFKNFQDTMLNRISENGTAQNKQLEMFKNALNELSERLITNSNDFKQSVSSSFQTSSDALNRKQDEFREHIILKFDAFDTSMKDDAKTNRQELTEGLNALNALFEKIIINSNDFKQSVTQSFQSSSTTLNQKQDEFREKTALKLDGFDASIKNDAKLNRQELNDGLKSFGAKFSENITEFNNQLSLKFSDLNKQQVDATAQAKSSIVEIRDTIEKQLKSIREDNTQQLTEMRKTVDEKLQSTLEKRLGESFKQVSDRLEQVHKGLGEMQTLAIGVGDLKKVLSNVKTRGILGEYQLGNILEQVLTPEQYSTNVATKQGSQANVEFAVKLPGKADEKTVWLPMDSKFPLESYQLLLVAYEEAEPTKIDNAQKVLLKVVENFAKDISTKYILIVPDYGG